jgi:hypothetical protein
LPSTIPDTAGEPAVLAHLEDDLAQYCTALTPDPWAGPRTVGLLTIGRPLDPAAAEALRFNPWTTGEGIVPVGRLNRLRRPSYASSQQGRPARITRR